MFLTLIPKCPAAVIIPGHQEAYVVLSNQPDSLGRVPAVPYRTDVEARQVIDNWDWEKNTARHPSHDYKQWKWLPGNSDAMVLK